jgi:hypothetical protein
VRAFRAALPLLSHPATVLSGELSRYLFTPPGPSVPHPTILHKAAMTARLRNCTPRPRLRWNAAQASGFRLALTVASAPLGSRLLRLSPCPPLRPRVRLCVRSRVRACVHSCVRSSVRARPGRTPGSDQARQPRQQRSLGSERGLATPSPDGKGEIPLGPSVKIMPVDSYSTLGRSCEPAFKWISDPGQAGSGRGLRGGVRRSRVAGPRWAATR